jgi:hypothetical protein
MDPAARRRAGPDLAGSGPSVVDAPPGRPRRLLSLQQTVGNEAVARLVQRLREGSETRPRDPLRSSLGVFTPMPRGVLQRVVNYDTLDGTTIFATVDDSANPITMTGALRVDEANEVAIKGSLTYREVADIPAAAVSDSIFARFGGDVRALDIKTITAVPQGRRIGHVLAWHLARLAGARGIGFVTAGDVSAARDPFYTPLGFVDFKNAPSWASLVRRKDELQQQMAGAAITPAISSEYERVVALMAANKIFISTAELEANALRGWSQRWRSAV